MPSPFPGMDPFLEMNPTWHVFHGWFIRKLAELHLPKARERGCWIDVERSVYQRESTGELALVGEPDALSWLGSAPVATAVRPSGLAVPRAVNEVVLDLEDPECVRQDYLVVRERGRFERILAVVELLSPANKSGEHALKYRVQRRRYLSSGSHFLELDFLRKGENPSRDLFPDLPPSPWFIYLARKFEIGRHEEGYPVELRQPLPLIGLPLTPDRPDLPLDLQATFDAAYELTVRPGSIDYVNEPIPDPPFSPDDVAWIRETVNRASTPSETNGTSHESL